MTLSNTPLKPLYWLYLPLLWMAAQIGLELTLDDNTLINLHAENGPHELIQFFMLVAGAIVAARILFGMDKSNKWLVAWVVAAFAACTFVAIEEMSWGQSVFKWGTPEFWAHINVQEETNLHNTSTWLNQKPRILLAIGIVTGGLLIPLAKKYKPSWVPKKFDIIYPPATLGVTAALYLFVRLTEKAANVFFDMDIWARPSEIEEVYFFYFVLLYLVVMKKRLIPGN
jgi:hypothetical protein